MIILFLNSINDADFNCWTFLVFAIFLYLDRNCPTMFVRHFCTTKRLNFLSSKLLACREVSSQQNIMLCNMCCQMLFRIYGTFVYQNYVLQWILSLKAVRDMHSWIIWHSLKSILLVHFCWMHWMYFTICM